MENPNPTMDNSTVPPGEEKTPQNGYADGSGRRSDYEVPKTSAMEADANGVKPNAPLKPLR